MKGRVCVVGNLNMDLILRGVGHLPDWGRGVECTGHLLTSSGQAGYLALGLGALGVETDVVGNVGNDAWGAQIVEDLRRAGVGVDAIEVSDSVPTALCVAIARTGDGERAFIGSMAHLAEFDVAMVQRHRATLEQAQVVCVVGMFDLAGFGVPGAADVLSWARKNGKTTLLDTGGDPDGWPPTTVRAIEALLGDVSYLVINSFEAAGISGEDDPWQACAALRARTGGSVIVKCGADGSYGLDATGRHRVPAAAVTPADAVGAGDSYDAGLLSGLVRGLPFDECMSVATAVATIYVGRRENRYPSPAEVSAFLAAHALSGTAPDIAGGEKPTTAKQEDSHT